MSLNRFEYTSQVTDIRHLGKVATHWSVAQDIKPLLEVHARLPALRSCIAALAKNTTLQTEWKRLVPALDHLPTRSSPSYAYHWIWLTEPQATGGLQYFIGEAKPQHQLARANALWLSALEYLPVRVSEKSIAEGPLASVTKVSAELPTRDGKRIDLALQGATETDPVLLIIEAKFGHLLSDGQLQSYEKEAEFQLAATSGLMVEYLVVAPALVSADARKMADATKPWRFASWAQLLASFEKHLPAEADDEDFARFRATIWDRAFQ